jgi:hypothetical protein
MRPPKNEQLPDSSMGVYVTSRAIAANLKNQLIPKLPNDFNIDSGARRAIHTGNLRRKGGDGLGVFLGRRSYS